MIDAAGSEKMLEHCEQGQRRRQTPEHALKSGELKCKHLTAQSFTAPANALGKEKHDITTITTNTY